MSFYDENYYMQSRKFNDGKHYKTNKKDKVATRYRALFLFLIGCALAFINFFIIAIYNERTKNYVSVDADVIENYVNSFTEETNFFNQFIVVGYYFNNTYYQKSFNPYFYRFEINKIEVKVNPNNPIDAILHVRYEYFAYLFVGILIAIISFIILLINRASEDDE